MGPDKTLGDNGSRVSDGTRFESPSEALHRTMLDKHSQPWSRVRHPECLNRLKYISEVTNRFTDSDVWSYVLFISEPESQHVNYGEQITGMCLRKGHDVHNYCEHKNRHPPS